MRCAMTKHSSLDVGTSPYWADSVPFPTFTKIDRDIDVDVVVVGGGITGLTTAYLLSAAGKSVAVLERGKCGEIDTGHTTAHLTMVTDRRLSELVRRFGRSHAQAVWDAGLAAIAQIEQIVARQRDRLCVQLGRRVPARARWRGCRGRCRIIPRGCGDWRASSDLTRSSSRTCRSRRPGLRFEDQARFHPRKYLAGLANAVRERGARSSNSAAPRSSSSARFASRPMIAGCDAETLSSRRTIRWPAWRAR